MSGATWEGFDELNALLDRLGQPPPEGMFEELEEVIQRDNERGILAGTDRNGNPMKPTKRQGLAQGHWAGTVLPDGRIVRYYQSGQTPGPRAPADGGDGSGPPLAPKGKQSRVIKDLVTAHFENKPGEWHVIGAWENVLSRKGVPFLPFHFRGEGKLATRDIAGLRPEGLAEAKEVVAKWTQRVVRGY